MIYDKKYEYIKDLGEGGFGKVYLAKERLSNRLVAIKQLKSMDKVEQQNIIHEIETVSKFDHQNIVTYYHHFWQDEQLFMVMEYCASGSLRSKMKRGPIPSSIAFEWVQSLVECLRIVHRNGIVHHDIKPDNILFTKSGLIKISDFGIANTMAGTRAYMSPDLLTSNNELKIDPRADIYALGVTLMEMLTGINPFFFKTNEEIAEFHQKAEFPIKHLPNWQQEIILKAINKVPELRFQYMVEFEEAVKAKSVPMIFSKDILKAAELAEYAERALKTKKWRNAAKYLEIAYQKYPSNVLVLQAYGKYWLQRQHLDKAKWSFNKALSLNPRLVIQKELGWINLENKNYPIAISLLSDHLHRHPSDYEAYNLLIRCYYETNRYEPAMELAKVLSESSEKFSCFANNYYICCAMHNLGQVVFPETVLKAPDNPFVGYNFSVVLDDKSTHNLDKPPTLKSKLLFMDFRFNNYAKNTVFFMNADDQGIPDSCSKTIIKIGRKGYDVNDIEVDGGSSISRRHCLIVNCKDDVWINDLGSNGTYLNGEKVISKAPVLGLNKLKLGNVEFSVTTDRTKLL